MKLDYATFWHRLPVYPEGVKHRTDNEFLVPEGKPLIEAMHEFLGEDKTVRYYHTNPQDNFLLLEFES